MPYRESLARNCWYVAAASPDVAPRQPYAVTLAGTLVVLFRKHDGQIAALEDVCAHRHAPLSLGFVEAGGIRCMYHGILFDAEGHCLEVPGQDLIPPQAKVPAYPVVERHGWIWVWIGEAAAADAALIPPAVAGDHPDWITAQAHLDYEANYGLVADNLLDFSHLSYVHAQSFRADLKWANIKPKATPVERGIRIERWIPQAPALMSARHVAGQMTDTWQGYTFYVPGILVMETLYCEPGTAAASDFKKPTSGVLVRNCASQAVTGMTSRTSRYFYAVALPHDGADQATANHILTVSRGAFEEDRAMIEAQQLRVEACPGRRPIPTAVDSALVMFHRILDRLDRASSAPGQVQAGEVEQGRLVPAE